MRHYSVLLNSLSLLGLVYGATEVLAMAERPQKDAAFYIKEMAEPTQNTQQKKVYFPKKILATCEPTESAMGNIATGIYIVENGNFYGFEGYSVINAINPKLQKFLKSDKKAADDLFNMIDKIKFNQIEFDSYQRNADFCSIIYSNNASEHQVRWVKDPMIRELNPPPAEVINLFNSIQEKALNKSSDI